MIRFARLTEVPPAAILAHMRDPRMAAHMPLMKEPWTPGTVTAFIAKKEANWARDGLGHWAILQDDTYIGWGGFERDGDAWDFGLVLTSDAFGMGMKITRAALDFARNDPRIDMVTFLLPPSRRNLSALKRLGALPDGTVINDGAGFLRFRLTLA